jgi:hypothetical protein
MRRRIVSGVVAAFVLLASIALPYYVQVNNMITPQNSYLLLVALCFGAFIVVTVFLMWKAKSHLKNVIKGIFVKVDDSDEPLSYRWALIGLVLLIMLQAALSQFMGMSMIVALFITLVFGIMSLIFTWQVSSAGILRVDSTFDPMMTLITIAGGRRIGSANFTIDSIQARGFRTDISQLPMPTISHLH